MSDIESAWAPTGPQAELIGRDHTRLVEACPGAGKTRAIVARYQRLVGSKRRQGIALLSFTNAAIDEVRLRCNDPDVFRSPNFVGTFDSFINRFITGPAMSASKGRYPQFVESWRSTSSASFSTPKLPNGVEFSLENFAWQEDMSYRFMPERATGRFGNSLRKEHGSNAAYVDARALQLRTQLVNDQMIVPCSESRHIARRLFADDERRALSEVILSRFEELIVDEAQDCGPEELEILERAIAIGIRVVAVADPDQAIFEFRRADPKAVRSFGDEIGRGTRLSGNFRSSPSIVRVGECLRASSDIDKSVGPESSNSVGIEVFEFDEVGEVAGAVRERLLASEMAMEACVILAHRSDDAAACAGATPGSGTSRRAVLVLADVAIALSSDDDPLRRRRKLFAAERALLRAAGATGAGTIDEDLELLGVSPRWIRDAAIRVVLGVDPHRHDRETYTSAVRQIIHALPWPSGVQITNQRLAKPPDREWSSLPVEYEGDFAPLPWMTVHAAKGREFDAVTLVIPGNLRQDDSGRNSLDHWEQNSDAESRRVLYVGATRARKKLLMAVHSTHYSRVMALLRHARANTD